jgi:hypothetical protein
VKCLEKGFGPKAHDVAREMRRLHNEELYDVYVLFTKYYSGDQINNTVFFDSITRTPNFFDIPFDV